MNIVRRVFDRFVKQASWDGKLVGKDFRLTWDYYTWKLEELPQKGKKKLRVATHRTFLELGSSSEVNASAFIPENILRAKHVSSSDSYDNVKDKVQEAFLEAAKEVMEQTDRAREHLKYLLDSKWDEDNVHFLQVTPENVEPFTTKGKDFAVYVSWTEFEATSPQSDFQQSDPYYSKIVSTAAASARKLYQTLKANPGAISGISYDKFDDWLKGQKINYKYEHSVWH
jgi:hypothetical protein